MVLRAYSLVYLIKYIVLIVLVIFITFIISTFTCTAQAWEDEDLKWTDSKTETLHWGDTFEHGEYKVEAYDFPRTNYKGQIGTPYAGINLYKDDTLIATQSMVIWDNFICEGEIRITVADLMPDSDVHWNNDTYDPWASITAELLAFPDIDISVKTDKDSYELMNSKIPVTITIKNQGDAPLEDVNLFIDTGGLEFHESCTNKETHYIYDLINNDQTQTETFELEIPSHMKDTVYDISVRLTGIDQKDKSYNYSGNKEFTIKKMIYIMKESKSNIFMKDTALVQLTIRNYGTYAVNNIILKDTLGDFFQSIGSPPLEWNFDLGPGQYRDFKYTIKPIKPDKDGHTLPKAEARWEVSGTEYNKSSNAPKIIVHGSKILLDKKVSPSNVDINGDVTVTVTATNAGDVKASVDIFDDSTLPDNVILVSGKLTTSKILGEGESVSLSYVVAADTDGIYELSQAIAVFNDLQGYQGEEISNSPSFTAGTPPIATRTVYPGQTQAPTTTPGPTSTRQEPGFGIAACLMGLIMAIFLTMRK